MRKGSAEVFCDSSLKTFISLQKEEEKKRAGEKEQDSVADMTC